MTFRRWSAAAIIQTDRLVLEPLRLDHAAEVEAALYDERLHEYIGGHPATLDQLRERYGRLVIGSSPDGMQGWCNWITRERASGLVGDTWVVAMPYQGQGYATESAAAMSEWLLQHGVDVLVAHVHPEHRASIGVARRLGMAQTSVMVDGETRWTR